MSIAALLRANPVFQRLQARDNFVATTVVELRHWEEIEEASTWCAVQWEVYDRQSRRLVGAEDRATCFEFACVDFAAEFLMRFGASGTSR